MFIFVSLACFPPQQLPSHSRPYFLSYLLPATRCFQKNAPAGLNLFSGKVPGLTPAVACPRVLVLNLYLFIYHHLKLSLHWGNPVLIQYKLQLLKLLSQVTPLLPGKKPSFPPAVQQTDCPGGTHTTSTAPPPPSAGGFLKLATRLSPAPTPRGELPPLPSPPFIISHLE